MSSLSSVDSCSSAVFVHNFKEEGERVNERLDNATDNPISGPQHFWADRYRASQLATLKDRVFRGAILLERCRAAFMRVNHFLFPEGPQPQGIHALVDLFQSATPIREALIRRVVLGANAAMGYIRSQHPTMRFSSPATGSRLEQKFLDGTAASAKMLVDRLHDQLIDSSLPVKDEPV